MPHQRFRAARTSSAMCMAVRAGGSIWLTAQSGFDLDGVFRGHGDAAAQADQAMRNAAVLLEEAGAGLGQVRKVTTYVTDRAWLAQVAAVIVRHFSVGDPAQVTVIVSGLSAPEMLVAIEIEAVAAG